MLFFREVKKVVVSVSYILFVIVIAAALHSQGVLNFRDDKISRPQAGENYGTTRKEIPEIVMPAALENLLREFSENNYRTYPFGIMKSVKLNSDEQGEIAKILSGITGVDKEEVIRAVSDAAGAGGDGIGMEIGGNAQADSDGNFIFLQTGETEGQERNLTVRSDMDYDEFKKMMQRVDDILGGGSDYNAESLIDFGVVPLSYDEAVLKYELAVSRDKITGGYARLFSDYAVAMVMSIMPVFLAVVMCMKDRRNKMAEIIDIRKVSSASLVIVRYLAIVTAAMLPVILLSYISNASVWGMYHGAQLDYLAPLKYDLGWIMPSVMFAAAIGMCLTELTNRPVAIAVQSFWWLVDINAGIRSISHAYALFRLAPRHNAGAMTYFRTQEYVDNFGRLSANRLLFIGLSILLTGITVAVHEAKRKGK